MKEGTVSVDGCQDACPNRVVLHVGTEVTTNLGFQTLMESIANNRSQKEAAHMYQE